VFFVRTNDDNDRSFGVTGVHCSATATSSQPLANRNKGSNLRTTLRLRQTAANGINERANETNKRNNSGVSIEGVHSQPASALRLVLKERTTSKFREKVSTGSAERNSSNCLFRQLFQPTNTSNEHQPSPARTSTAHRSCSSTSD
jgi:hypothetical protein